MIVIHTTIVFILVMNDMTAITTIDQCGIAGIKAIQQVIIN